MIDANPYAHARPLRGWLLIEPSHEQHRRGPLWLPEARKKLYPSSGLVLRTGELEQDIRVGDIVVFNLMNLPHVVGDAYKSFYEKLYIIHERVCLGVIREW